MTRIPTSDEWQAITRLFDALVDLPPAQRTARLDAAGQPGFVEEEVRQMLTALDGEGVLDRPAPPVDAQEGAPPPLPPGTAIGAFTIDRLIGSGGMGEVYLAHRTRDFVQQVAIKLLREEAEGRGASFDAERALLARLEHPGIARLIDGGMAADGRPWMAMEFVEGQAITAWCADHAAPLAQRLALFLAVADAVSYAHARLVVHRDIKPANILVDGDGRARLLDFGIASLADSAGAATAMLTPDYAAPEQLDGGAATVATDVYALGLTLFELLAGRSPWADAPRRMPALVRRLAVGTPQRLSQVTGPTPVPPDRLKGDLDAIVARAMAADPAARYASVADLAGDVRRHIALRPVAARTGERGYAARRFLRRNRWGVAAGALLALSLLAGTAGIAWQARRTVIERDIAIAQVARVEAVNNAVLLMFRRAQEVGQGGDTTARQLLDDSARQVTAALDGSGADASVVAALAELYVLIQDQVAAGTLLERALAARHMRADPPARAHLQLLLADIKAKAGDTVQAMRLLDAADPVWARDPARFRRDRLESVALRAQMLRLSGERAQAIAMLEASLPEAERAYAAEPRELLTRYANLAVHLAESNRLEPLGQLLDKAEAAVARLRQQGTPPDLALMQMRAAWQLRTDQPARALATTQKLIAIRRQTSGESGGVALDLLQLGRAQFALGRPAEALETLGRARTMAQRYIGAASQPALVAAISEAEVATATGQLDRAQALLAGAEADVTRIGATSSPYGLFLRVRAALRIAQRDPVQAHADLDRAAAIFAALGPVGAPYAKDIPALRRKLAALE